MGRFAGMLTPTPSVITEEALKRIGQLYTVETELRGLPAAQRLAQRQMRTVPLLNGLEG